VYESDDCEEVRDGSTEKKKKSTVGHGKRSLDRATETVRRKDFQKGHLHSKYL